MSGSFNEINLILIAKQYKNVIEIVVVYTGDKTFFMLDEIFRKYEFIAVADGYFIIFHLID